MAVKSGKNTLATSHFQSALNAFIAETGKKKIEVAAELGITSGNLSDYLNGKKVPSLAMMEEIANKLGRDLADMLTEGRAILAGESPANPPVAAETPPAPGPSRDDEFEWLKKENALLRKLEAQIDKVNELIDMRNKLALKLDEKDRQLDEREKIISTTVEALRIKDIEVAEKRELLTGKDKIIQQLVDLLKEAGLEHTIPPALINSIRTNREKSPER